MMCKMYATKKTGVPWLEKVPKHWDIRPFFSIALERRESNKEMLEDNLLSLSYGRIIQKDIKSNDGLLPESFSTYQIVYPDDIIFRLTDLQNDKRSLRTAIVRRKGIITSAYIAARPIKIVPLYLNYLLRIYDISKVFYSMGGGLRQSLKLSDIKHLPILLPSISEQFSIIKFLEHETAKINTLIIEQQKLITLLTEKRQAIISHAVTKGLDADVPMKDSGVVWLGEIPAHWKIKRIKSIFRLITEKTNHHKYRVGLENIESWSAKFVNTNSKFEGDGIAFKAKDILFGKLRPYLAKVFLAPQEGEAVGDFHILRTKSQEIQEKFFVYKLLDFNLIKLITSATFGAKMPRVSWDFMANLPITFPSSSEQLKIVTFLDRETSKIDKLITEVNRAIELLKERRTALISAAVTGKIDVRDITPDLPMESSPDVQFTPGTPL